MSPPTKNIRSPWALAVRAVRAVLNEFEPRTAVLIVEMVLHAHGQVRGEAPESKLTEAEWWLFWSLYRRAVKEGAQVGTGSDAAISRNAVRRRELRLLTRYRNRVIETVRAYVHDPAPSLAAGYSNGTVSRIADAILQLPLDDAKEERSAS